MKPFIYNLNFVKEQSSKRLFNVVSLFAGGGGSSTGYRLAGGEVLAINEFIVDAYKCYATNYPDTYIFTEDIRKLTGDIILDKIGLKQGELDILDGSPPCASFSIAGNREKDWGKEKKYSDSKQRTDDLFFEFARILKEVQPRVFICENVKGITLGEAGNLLGSQQIGLFQKSESIYDELTNAGYRVRFMVLNAKNYGVPQSRSRTIFIGVRSDIKAEIVFPIGENKDFVSTNNSFIGIENLESDLKEANIEKYAIGEELKKLIRGEQSEKYFSLIKQDPDLPSPTFTATVGCISAASVCHWDNRKFTIKEAIRICSFPDDYYLGEKYSKKAERLGRAVPPLMMKAIAEQVYNTILKPLKSNL